MSIILQQTQFLRKIIKNLWSGIKNSNVYRKQTGNEQSELDGNYVEFSRTLPCLQTRAFPWITGNTGPVRADSNFSREDRNNGFFFLIVKHKQLIQTVVSFLSGFCVHFPYSTGLHTSRKQRAFPSYDNMNKVPTFFVSKKFCSWLFLPSVHRKGINSYNHPWQILLITAPSSAEARKPLCHANNNPLEILLKIIQSLAPP